MIGRTATGFFALEVLTLAPATLITAFETGLGAGLGDFFGAAFARMPAADFFDVAPDSTCLLTGLTAFTGPAFEDLTALGEGFFFAAVLGADLGTGFAGTAFFLAGAFMRLRNRSGATQCGVAPHERSVGRATRPSNGFIAKLTNANARLQRGTCWGCRFSKALHSADNGGSSGATGVRSA